MIRVIPGEVWKKGNLRRARWASLVIIISFHVNNICGKILIFVKSRSELEIFDVTR